MIARPISAAYYGPPANSPAAPDPRETARRISLCSFANYRITSPKRESSVSLSTLALPSGLVPAVICGWPCHLRPRHDHRHRRHDHRGAGDWFGRGGGRLRGGHQRYRGWGIGGGSTRHRQTPRGRGRDMTMAGPMPLLQVGRCSLEQDSPADQSTHRRSLVDAWSCSRSYRGEVTSGSEHAPPPGPIGRRKAIVPEHFADEPR